MSEKNSITFLNPSEFVEEFNLQKGMHVADFGSGAGHFSLAMARIIGKEGNVSAVDIQSHLLDVLKGHARLEGFLQIRTIQGNLEEENGSTLPDNSQDLVLLSNILHQVEGKDRVIKEAHRVLKDGGKLIIVDWTEGAAFGPADKVPGAHAEKLAIDAGFSLVSELDAGSGHYAMQFKK